MAKPTTLLHYTSWNSFCGMIQPILNNEEGINKELCFHASHIYAMNDMTEGKLIFDFFFTGSKILDDIEGKMEEVRKETGEPYVVSFSRSTKDIEQNNIPMWMMYADGGKGVCLHFDYESIKENINDNVKMVECKYQNLEEIKKNAREKRDTIKKDHKKGIDITHQLQEMLLEAPSYKWKNWKYEKEWRLVCVSKSPKFKVGRLGLVPYQEIKLPLSALKQITIGPCANQEVIEHTLNILKRNIGEEAINLKIDSSNLKIQ